MTLAVGTALQNGTYVIDAWVTEDAVGPIYLAMDVPKGQWIQLRILGSRRPETLPDAAQRQGFYQYLDRVNSLDQAALPARLRGFEEEGVCYQTFASPSGTPLDRLVTEAGALAARPSMAIVQRLAETMEILQPLGWAGLRLTPDQVWYDPEKQTVTFTGFDLPPSDPAIPDTSSPDVPGPDTTGPDAPDTDATGHKSATPAEAALVHGLTHLLYFLLTAQRAEATHAPLAVEVRRRHPELPTVVDTALALGSPRLLNGATSPLQAPTLTLTEWKALLPPPEQLPASPVPRATPQQFTSPATVVVLGQSDPGAQPQATIDYPAPVTVSAGSTQRRRASLPLLALALTGLVATASGLGFGFYARLQPASSASQDRLNPNQSFPPLSDWNGDDLWQPWTDAPSRRDRPDYSDAPPPGSAPVPDFAPDPQEPAAPPPAVPQPEIIPEPIPEPAEAVEAPVDPPAAPEFEPIPPSAPAPLPVEPAPAPQPLPAPAPIEPAPTEGAAPPPLVPTPQPSAPVPSSS